VSSICPDQFPTPHRDHTAGRKHFQESKGAAVSSEKTRQRVSLREKLTEIKEKTEDKEIVPVKMKDKEKVL